MEPRHSFRVQFQHKLESIRSDVLKMGGEAGDMVREATEALLTANPERCAGVFAMDDEIDLAERQLVHRTMATMLEAPVAADLRLLVCSFGIVSEIEKVGDDAVKLARRGVRLGTAFPNELKRPLQDLSDLARHSFSAALRLYTDYSAELREQIVTGDTEIDQAYSVARSRALDLMKEHPEQAEDYLRTADSFRALEHVADRAVAIANHMRMIYEPEIPPFEGDSA